MRHTFPQNLRGRRALERHKKEPWTLHALGLLQVVVSACRLFLIRAAGCRGDGLPPGSRAYQSNSSLTTITCNLAALICLPAPRWRDRLSSKHTVCYAASCCCKRADTSFTWALVSLPEPLLLARGLPGLACGDLMDGTPAKSVREPRWRIMPGPCVPAVVEKRLGAQVCSYPEVSKHMGVDREREAGTRGIRPFFGRLHP
jgi:hypothetical protein